MSGEARTIALFGGSFDPPHVAHVLAVAWLVSAGPVDAVWIAPVSRHPFAKELTPFAQRMAMCEQAFSWLGPRVALCADEDRAGASGRTLDLLDVLEARAPDAGFRLVIGSDQVAAHGRWWRFDELVRRAPPLVLGRGDAPDDPAFPALLRLPAISSTAVRAHVAAGAPIAGMVPHAVAASIARWGLYRRDQP